MKCIYLVFCTLLLCVSVINIRAKGAVTPSSASGIKQTALSMLKSDKIQRLDIYCISPDVLTRHALTPNDLERLYDYKISIRDFQISPIKLDLINGLERSLLKESKESPDSRWGYVFYDKHNTRILTIYFDGPGWLGLINGKPVIADKKFVKLLEPRFSKLWELEHK